MLPPTLPLPRAAQTALWLASPLRLFDWCQRHYGDVFTLRLLGIGDNVMLASPEAIREVFTGDPDVLHAGEANGVFLRSLVGGGSLLLLDGRAHLRERKLLLPPFHGERMYAYAAKMRAVTDAALDALPVGRPVPLQPFFQRITLEVILRTVFGLEEGARLARLQMTIARLLDSATSPARLIPVLMGLDLFRLLPDHPTSRLKAEMDREIYTLIATRRAAPTGGDDVLSLLLGARHEDGQGMSDDELRDELVTLLVAGHETTATSMTWAVQCLLAHPAALRAIEEDLLRGGTDVLDAAIKEALRLRPILAVVARRLKASITVGGYTLPAGMTVAPCVYLAHRRREIYPEPERFLLERFLGRKPDPNAWLPFGGGARRCLGMAFALYEMRVVLGAVLRRARLRLPPEGAAQTVRRGISLAPARGGPVIVDAVRPQS